jgi:PAS domain S-box-containing protein
VWQAAFEASRDAIIVADNDGHVVEANSAAAALLGVSLEKLLSKRLVDFVDPSQEFARKWIDVIKKRDFEGEIRLVRADGNIIEVHAYAMANICPGKHLSVLRDITLKNYEKRQLRLARSRARRASDELASMAQLPLENPNPVFRASRDGEVIFANPAATRFFREIGYISGTVLPSALARGIRAAMDSGKTEEVEVTTPNQRVISFSLTPNRGYVNLYGRDVTEHKRAEAEMRRNEKHWRGVFDGAPVPIWEEDFSRVAGEFGELRRKGVTDFRTYFQALPDEVQRLAGLVNITAMNRASIELFGQPQSGELPEALTGYLSRRSKPIFAEERAMLAEGGTSFSGEVPVRDAAGNERVVQLFLSVMPGFEDTLARVLVSFVDLTARKQVEELLQQARSQLEDYTRHLEKMVDARTQELRQSLEDLEAFSYGFARFACAAP